MPELAYGFHLLLQGLNLATGSLALPRVGKQTNFLQEHWLYSKVVLHAWCSFEIHSNFCNFKLTIMFHFRNTSKSQILWKKWSYSGGEKGTVWDNEEFKRMKLNNWKQNYMKSLFLLFFFLQENEFQVPMCAQNTKVSTDHRRSSFNTEELISFHPKEKWTHTTVDVYWIKEKIC